MACLRVLRGSRHFDYPLAGSSLSIGSSEDNDIELTDDPEVSSSHAVVEAAGDRQFNVRDRGSLNGTYVNETLIGNDPRRLSHGDRLRLGQTAVFFLVGDEVEARPKARARSRRAPKTREAVAAAPPKLSSDHRLGDLLVLLEINKALNSETDPGRLLDLIMDTAIHLTNAERGFLVMVKGQELAFKVARNVDYSVINRPEFEISNSIIRRVVDKGEPVLTSNAQSELKDVQSVVDLDLLSLICVPLRVKSRILGTLYLDSRQLNSAFTESDRDLLVAFSDQAAIAIENARLLAEAKEKERMREELRIASLIQSSLLPRENPVVRGLDVAGAMVTAKEVGGDYYDFISGPGDDLCPCIGDVSGKGVPAGLIMMMARSVLRPLVAQITSTRDVLVEANRILGPDLREGLFMSLFLCRWDVQRSTLYYTSAGHELPILFRAAEQKPYMLKGGGIVAGAMDDVNEVLEEREVVLQPGDSVLLYTDGATEAKAPNGEMFEIERLTRAFAARSHLDARAMVRGLFQEIGAFADGAERHDDITLIAMKRRHERSGREVLMPGVLENQ